jgi:hypothetical protein
MEIASLNQINTTYGSQDTATVISKSASYDGMVESVRAGEGKAGSKGVALAIAK